MPYYVAIIPARSGSKGLKNKNIKPLCGKPMIYYSIRAALDSGCFDRVVVSTNSRSYGELANEFGAEVFYRGEDLSNSSASTFMVLKDLLQRLGHKQDMFTLLQPTSPLRTAYQVREAVDLFERHVDRYDFLVSVTEAPHSADLVKPLAEDGSLARFNADFKNYRRQNCCEYSPNGAIYIAKPDAYLEQGHFFGARSLGFVMDKASSVDIDDEIDFLLAEILISRIQSCESLASK